MSADRARRVQELFLLALDLPQGERAAWLEEMCAGDAGLRAEVDSLLEHHIEGTVFSDLPASVEARGPGVRSATRVGLGWLSIPPRWRPVAGTVAVFVALCGVYTWALERLSRDLDDRLRQELTVTLSAQSKALWIWIEERKQEARSWAKDEAVVRHVQAIVAAAEAPGFTREQLRALPEHEELEQRLEPFLSRYPEGEAMFSVQDRSGTPVSSIQAFSEQFGLTPDERAAAYVSRIFLGETRFVPPIYFDQWFRDPLPKAMQDTTTTWFNAPVRVPAAAGTGGGEEVGGEAGEEGRVIAAFGLGLISSYFDRVLEADEVLEDGQVYAFDAEAKLVSRPRASADLKDPLLPREPLSQSVARVRDPGGELVRGFVPTVRPDARPLTRLAHEAIHLGAEAAANEDRSTARTGAASPRPAIRGVILEPYRDFRGVEVVGSWEWLPDYDLGLAVELDAAAAREPLLVLRQAFAVLFGTLALVLGVVLWSSLRALRRMRQAAGRRIGPYTIEAVIGEGGVGRVYRARHDLLRRPTAVKLLREDRLSPEARRRFEREVRLAAQLEHPNTIQIYDYGHVERDAFYYAMELLDGENLAQAVWREGPMEPARVVHVLRQVCESLREAHERGMVHRDVKPQNVMLCRRAGVGDVVKVLDFGLAKHFEGGDEADLTRPASISGTLLYMAPERIRDPMTSDPRVDVYAVGALGHFLLRGARMFESSTDVDLIEQILGRDPPALPTGGVRAPSAALSELVERCLSKDPAARPASMEELLGALDACPEAGRWRVPRVPLHAEPDSDSGTGSGPASGPASADPPPALPAQEARGGVDARP